MAGYDRRLESSDIFASANIEDWALTAYLETYHKKNFYLEKWNEWKAFPDVTYWDELFTKEDILSSEFYREYIIKQGPKYQAFAGVIFKEQSRFLAFSCNYGESETDKALRATAILRIVGPHLQRAFELYRQMEGQRIYTNTLESSFDHIKAGVLVIDQQAHIHFANRRAEEMLRSQQIVKSSDRKLSFISPDDHNNVFADLDLLSKYAPAQTPKLVRLQLPTDNPHLAFVSVLIDKQSTAQLDAKERLLLPHRLVLFLIDPREQSDLDEDMIGSAINCTPAEARLVQSLVSGVSLRQHAEKIGTSYNTVRTQLQALFGKTQTNSQVELVAKLIRIFGIVK